MRSSRRRPSPERRLARAALRGSLSALTGETADRMAQEELHDLAAHAPAGHRAGALMVVGAANSGISSLCNALAGSDVVLVSECAGTTRDMVPVEIPGGGLLLDSPGDLARAIELGEASASPELAAVELGRALEHFETLAGRISPERFLDAIFARFCLGK